MRFKDIPGHEDIKERLIDMIQSGRLPHALLIQAPAGSGELMLARALESRLHCMSPAPDGDSCGRCPACQQTASHNHVDTHYTFPVLKPKNKESDSVVSADFMEQWNEFLDEDPYADFDLWLEKLGNPNGQPVVYVKEADALAKDLSFTPRSSRYKVAVIWLPERLKTETANKLLKLVEEPFDGTVLIFISNNPQAILPTIYSRLQRVDVKRLDYETVARIIQSDASGADYDEALDAAKASDGNVVVARSMLADAHNRMLLGEFISLMRLAYQRKVHDLKKWSDDMAATGREAQIKFLTYCCRMFRENFINNTGLDDILRMIGPEKEFSKKFSRFINSRNVLRLVEEFERAIADIRANGNAKIVFFDLAIQVILLIKT